MKFGTPIVDRITEQRASNVMEQACRSLADFYSKRPGYFKILEREEPGYAAIIYTIRNSVKEIDEAREA